MMKVKDGFKLECSCGCNLMNVYLGLKGDNIEIRCEDCGRVIGTANRYSFDWVDPEEELANADSID